MNKFIIRILKSKYTNLFIIILIFTLLFNDFDVMRADGAGIVGSIAATALNPVLEGLANFLILFTQLTDKLLTMALSFDNFFSVGVNAGWETVRDFANLFFALILLFVAISTVLDVGSLSNYSAKRMLPNFIATVLLINFSKSIVAVFIDISQIVMLEFYNAIIAGGGTGLQDTLMSQSSMASLKDNNWWDGVGNVGALQTNLLTIFLMIIVAGTTLWIALGLWIRVVKIWVSIMISPLAFMSITFPPLKSVWSQWYSTLQTVLVEGPMLLFFLYLAVVVLRASGLNSIATGKLDVASYTISIVLFMYAKMESEKAAASAPAFAKNIVNKVASVSTLGLGKPAGVGDMNTGDLLRAGKEGIDKGISKGARGIQFISGGKFRTADQLALAKKNQQEALEEGRGFFKEQKGVRGFINNLGQQSTQKGREAQTENYEYEQLQKRSSDTTGKFEPLSAKEKSKLNAFISKKSEEYKDMSSDELVDLKDKFEKEKNSIGIQAILNAGAKDLAGLEKAMKAKNSALKTLSIPELINQSLKSVGIEQGSSSYKSSFDRIASTAKGQDSSAAREIGVINKMQNDSDQLVRDEANQLFDSKGSYSSGSKQKIIGKLFSNKLAKSVRLKNLTDDPDYIKEYISSSSEDELSDERLFRDLAGSTRDALINEANKNPTDSKNQALLKGLKVNTNPTPTPTPSTPISSLTADNFKYNNSYDIVTIGIEINNIPNNELSDSNNWSNLSQQDKTDIKNYIANNINDNRFKNQKSKLQAP